MENTTTIALSRLVAQQRALDVTATNIANASTPGFHAERMVFSDWLVRQSAGAEPPGGATISYTQDRTTYRDNQARTAEPHRQRARSPGDRRHRRLFHRT